MRAVGTVALGAASSVALLTGSAAVAAPEAKAAVRIGANQIRVEGRDARAVITRAPFALSVAGRNGETVLRHVPNTRARPRLGAQVEEPLGTENIPDRALYQPFSFEVGGSVNPQFPATAWEGNNLLGGQAGRQYSATDVLSARRAGEGVELTIATTAPGRRIVASVAPDGGGAVRVRARVTPGTGVSSFGNSFASADDERFHGFGGRHPGVDHAGRSFLSFIQQENFGAGPFQPVADALPGSGGKSYLFPNGPMGAYYQQNIFVSSRPYGFLLNRPELTRWRMRSGDEPAWRLDTASTELDYTVATGDGRRAVARLSEINGRHRTPPDWALGPMLYRGVRVLSPEADNAQTYEAKVRADIERIDRERLDVSAYGIEGWGILQRETLKELVAEFRRRDIKPMFYVRAYVSQDAGNTEPPEVFLEAARNGYLVKTPAGTPFLFGSPFVVGAAGLIDFTNPEAVRWWKRRIRELLDMGAEGFMQDFGEQTLNEMRFADGRGGAEMHNQYPNLYHRVTREATDEYEREHPGRKVFFFTRAGFSGRPGAAAHEHANFPGDETTDWSVSSGLPSIVPDMLNRGLGGSYGFSTDIGGYADYHTGPVTKELFVRWSQAAALTPVFRVHNSSSSGTKMPWSFDSEALELYRRATALRKRAQPYIGRAWREAERTGLPVARPLWLSFPEDAEAARQSYQWMLGDDVLVAPVLEQGATTRRVYFPAGCWRHGETGREYRGAGYAEVPAALDSLPWFSRCGRKPF